MKNALLLTAIAAIIWGGAAPIMKLTLEEIPLFSLAFIRMGLASLILASFVHKKLKIDKKDFPKFLKAALFGVTLNLALFFAGLKYTAAINAAFLIAAVPIFTMVAAHFALNEKFTKKLIVASIIAFVGVGIIIGKPNGQFNLLSFFGNILLLLATISWVIHEIIAKKLLVKYDGSTVAFYTMAIGTFFFFPMFIYELFKNPTWIDNVTIRGYSGLLYGIFLASLVAYWAWQKGLSLLKTGEAAFFFYLDPISGSILAIILLGEKITPSLIFGGALIAASVILAEHKRKSHPLYK